MTLASLSRSTRRQLFTYLRRVMRKKQPAIDRLERELAAKRHAHKSTRATLRQLRDIRIAQLKREIAHG